MGFYVRLAPGLRLGFTERGLRTSIGPRGARLHLGAGSPGVSTGTGPYTYYHSLARSERSRSPASSAKLRQAQQVNAIWERLLSVHQEEFAPATKLVIDPPIPPDPRQLVRERRRSALQAVPYWQLLTRRRIKAQVKQHVAADLPGIIAANQQDHERLVAAEDERWARLLRNDPEVTMAQLAAAFDDNDMPAAPLSVDGSEASIAVLAPGEADIPERIGGVTDAGNISLRRIPKGERHSLTTSITCGYALVTARETLAVAPGLASVRVVVLRQADGPGGAGFTCILATRWTRSALADADWMESNALALVSASSTELLINVQGKSLQPIDLAEEPDLHTLLLAIEATDLDAATRDIG